MTFLPAPVLGCISMALFVTNLTLWIIPIYIVTIIKLLIPIKSIRDACVRALEIIGEGWVECNSIMAKILQIDIDVRGVEGLDYKGTYLVGANHQSWNDVFMIQVALNRHIPFPRFFLKQQLIWLPFLGQAWWALEMPFMKRHSKEQIAANPALRDEDLETTRRACEKYKTRPTTVLNFLEGTRFTPAKHAKQNSPYKHLLKPKAGGLAFTLAAMGDQMRNYLDVTIAYPRPLSFWDFMCGRMKGVVIDVKKILLPEWMVEGDYLHDKDFRNRFQEWVNQNWQAKDKELIEFIKHLNTAT